MTPEIIREIPRDANRTRAFGVTLYTEYPSRNSDEFVMEMNWAGYGDVSAASGVEFANLLMTAGTVAGMVEVFIKTFDWTIQEG